MPPPSGRGEPDGRSVGLIVFGGVLVLIATPFVVGSDFGRGLGVNVSLPLPLLVLAGVLVGFALKRRGR